jgi:hypothetical protein
MRRRNREVNIFNMSLLDILCGALGAFCFMMLALFPSYLTAQAGGGGEDERVKQAEQRADEAERKADEAEKKADQAKKDQSLVYFNIRWDNADDVDLWVKGPTGAIYSVAKDAADKKTGTIADRQHGPAGEGLWSADVQYPNTAWEVSAELHSQENAGTPVLVRGYATTRSTTRAGEETMSLFELGTVTLKQPRQKESFGRFVFDAAGENIQLTPATQQP